MNKNKLFSTSYIIFFLLGNALSLYAQTIERQNFEQAIHDLDFVQDSNQDERGILLAGSSGIQFTTAQLMEFQNKNHAEPQSRPRYIARENLPQNPQSPKVVQYPINKNLRHDEQQIFENQSNNQATIYRNPQTLGTNFLGGQFSDSFFFPPDSMGAVGRTQFIVCINGLIRTFNKATGTVDGVINTSLNSFFNSVRNGLNTSDPRIRFDRLANRWFITCINVPTNEINNRLMLAVSNTSTITPSTIWTFFFLDATGGRVLIKVLYILERQSLLMDHFLVEEHMWCRKAQYWELAQWLLIHFPPLIVVQGVE